MKINYRPEIDGLRAISVIAVILYHSDISHYFDGGFIGVDIFFVISGYLITSIILKELESTANFSFISFYERRIRRIIPPLLFVIIISLPFAWFFLLPDNLIDFAKSIISSLGFGSNFYFHYSENPYAAENSLLKPFLHTWSLSVEEQFYILFPIFIFLTFNYFRKYQIFLFLAIFFLSLLFAHLIGKNNPSFNFYILVSRVWELMAGALISYFYLYRKKDYNLFLNNILTGFGLFLIFISLIFFDDSMHHPSLVSLIPIFGVCLLIWYSSEQNFFTKILSSKILVGIGLISYSLYLWHFPIFAFCRNIDLFNLIQIKLLSFTLIFLMSIISFFFIENKSRDKKKISFKHLITYILIIVIIILVTSLSIILNNGFKHRFPSYLTDQLHFDTKNDILNKNDFDEQVLLVGDSHAHALWYDLKDQLTELNIPLTYFPTPIYVNNFKRKNRINNKEIHDFKIINNKIRNHILNNKDLTIILNSRYTLQFTEKYFVNSEGYRECDWDNCTGEKLVEIIEPNDVNAKSYNERFNLLKSGFISALNEITSLGHKIIIIYPVPEMGFNIPKIALKKYILNKLLFKDENFTLSVNYDEYIRRNKISFDILNQIKHENVYRVFPHKLLCNNKINGRCIANDKNQLLYYDDDHLSIWGSKIINNKIINVLSEIKELK